MMKVCTFGEFSIPTLIEELKAEVLVIYEFEDQEELKRKMVAFFKTLGLSAS